MGLSAAEADGWPAGGDSPPATPAPAPAPAGVLCFGLADVDADAEADADDERLGVGECDGRFVTDMPLPSEAFAAWPSSADEETAGRTVVAAPLLNAGPLPVISLYPVTPSATTATPPMISERRRCRRPRPRAGPLAPPAPRRSRRRETCPAASGGAGSHTALIAGP